MMGLLPFGYKPNTENHMKNVFISLLLIIVGIAGLMLIPSKQADAPMPWEVELMQDGNSKVFDIHLGTTTYGQAQQILRQYGKTAIFSQEGQESTVEAYFNSINMGGLSAKLILNLSASKEQINEMTSNALEARLQDSGAHKYTLNNNANEELVNATVTAITYIPSVKLDAEMVLHRFGQAERIEQLTDDETTEIWHYLSLGLTIQLNSQEKTILLYQSQ